MASIGGSPRWRASFGPAPRGLRVLRHAAFFDGGTVTASNVLTNFAARLAIKLGTVLEAPVQA